VSDLSGGVDLKKTTYECKKCGKACNGGGISFIATEGKTTISFVLSLNMDQLPEHACGEEHAVSVFADAVRKLKNGADQAKTQTLERTAEPVVSEEAA